MALEGAARPRRRARLHDHICARTRAPLCHERATITPSKSRTATDHPRRRCHGPSLRLHRHWSLCGGPETTSPPTAAQRLERSSPSGPLIGLPGRAPRWRMPGAARWARRARRSPVRRRRGREPQPDRCSRAGGLGPSTARRRRRPSAPRLALSLTPSANGCRTAETRCSRPCPCSSISRGAATGLVSPGRPGSGVFGGPGPPHARGTCPAGPDDVAVASSGHGPRDPDQQPFTLGRIQTPGSTGRELAGSDRMDSKASSAAPIMSRSDESWVRLIVTPSRAARSG